MYSTATDWPKLLLYSAWCMYSTATDFLPAEYGDDRRFPPPPSHSDESQGLELEQSPSLGVTIDSFVGKPGVGQHYRLVRQTPSQEQQVQEDAFGAGALCFCQPIELFAR
jgi:hypothetical protein